MPQKQMPIKSILSPLQPPRAAIPLNGSMQSLGERHARFKAKIALRSRHVTPPIALTQDFILVAVQRTQLKRRQRNLLRRPTYHLYKPKRRLDRHDKPPSELSLDYSAKIALAVVAVFRNQICIASRSALKSIDYRSSQIFDIDKR